MTGPSGLRHSSNRHDVALSDVVFVERFGDRSAKQPEIGNRHSDVQHLLGTRYFQIADLVSDRDFNRRIGLKTRSKHPENLSRQYASDRPRCAGLEHNSIYDLANFGLLSGWLQKINNREDVLTFAVSA